MITITGIPSSQKRHRHTRSGIVYDPSSSDKKNFILKLLDHKPDKPINGSITILITFVFPYPKKYFRSGRYKDLLKDNAPKHHAVKPDLDNLIKFLLDVLQDAKFIDNDSRICEILAKKCYGKDPRTEFDLCETGE